MTNQEKIDNVEMAVALQKREQYGTENGLAFVLGYRFGWNSLHAREIAKLVWSERQNHAS